MNANWIGLYLLLVAIAAFQSPGFWEAALVDHDAVSALRSYTEHFLWGFFWRTPPLLAAIAAVNIGAQDTTSMIRRLAFAIVAGVVIGKVLGEVVMRPLFPAYVPLPTIVLATGSLAQLLPAALCAGLYLFLRRSLRDAQALHDEAMRRVASERSLAEGRLILMQAQIEPHFLFNSLANARRLVQLDPARGREMVRHLTHYLAAALPQMRDAQSTLGRELAMAEAYLAVQQIRMGERLTWKFEIDQELRVMPCPPLLLVTLVENAIKHGLAPLPEGGSIRVDAHRCDEGIRLRVVDSGRGLSATSGTGVGLANIRARLAAEYGRRDLLHLSQNLTAGVTATVVIPSATPSPVPA